MVEVVRVVDQAADPHDQVLDAREVEVEREFVGEISSVQLPQEELREVDHASTARRL